jgi:ribosomal protein L10
LNELDSELVIGKNTVIKKALEIRVAPLKADQESLEFYQRFGGHDEKLNVLKPLLVGKFGLIFTNKSVFDLKQTI